MDDGRLCGHGRGPGNVIFVKKSCARRSSTRASSPFQNSADQKLATSGQPV
jgi:hypothetical protein